jgi:hypothetical protein
MAKNPVFLICVLLLIGGICSSFYDPAVERIQTIYQSQIGVQERPAGSNWGADIKKYLAHTNVKSPAPWCAAFVRFCLDSAGVKTNISAYSPTAHNGKNIVYARGKFQKEMEPGDVFTIYYVAMKRIAHTGFVDRKLNNSIVETVEGNTNNALSREGYIVARKRRSFHTLYSITRWR